MSLFEKYKPEMVMLGLQFCYAGIALTTRAALLDGSSPRVFVVYRQAIATVVIAPIAYFSSKRRKTSCSLGLWSFSLIFITAFIGITINQNVYFEGLYLASSSLASAMDNLIPAITFVIAASVGLEKVAFRSLRSMAKVAGTIICVGGGMSMALLKGQKLLNINLVPQNSVFGSGGEDWLLGSLFLFGRCCCWSLWLILQVPMAACHPDHLSLSAWLCFFATLQSAIFAFLFEPDLKAWNLHSSYEVLSCFYSGIIGSAVSFFALAWCISKRGPLFSAMFNPLSTVIVTILACILLHEELYTGSLAGSFAVVGGLYVVLWGKSKDIKETKIEANYNDDETGLIKALIDESSEKTCKVDFQEPLLNLKCSDIC